MKLTFGAMSRVVGAACAMVLVFGGIPVSATTMCDGQVATVVGTSGSDTLVGTMGVDVIAGLEGNDIISGLEGNDVICAGIGNDTVYGDAASLSLAAVGGNDRIFGEDGNDTLVGDFGTFVLPLSLSLPGSVDYIDGGNGNDLIYGDAIDVDVSIGVIGAVSFDDTLYGGAGADTIYGDARTMTASTLGVIAVVGSSNTIDGGLSEDKIYGNYKTVNTFGAMVGSGWNDTIYANDGEDIIVGDTEVGQGSLLPIIPGSFVDTIDGGLDDDAADGGPGADVCTNVENVTSC